MTRVEPQRQKKPYTSKSL